MLNDDAFALVTEETQVVRCRKTLTAGPSDRLPIAEAIGLADVAVPDKRTDESRQVSPDNRSQTHEPVRDHTLPPTHSTNG